MHDCRNIVILFLLTVPLPMGASVHRSIRQVLGNGVTGEVRPQTSSVASR
jgi:hypothetical protein